MNGKGFLHKDIKPENLLFDENGYVIITDLGVAARIDDRVKIISGTPGYMSPELYLDKCYSINSDYFSLGVLGYELMLGKRPYSTVNKHEFKESLRNTEVQINSNEIPEGWTTPAADFINKVSYYNSDILNYIVVN
jgi:serine/threonine protein kinase